MQQSLGAHIQPMTYLKRWIVPSHESVWNKKMVYVFPYNKYEHIKQISVDNDFFKQDSYFWVLDENGVIDNKVEGVLSWEYETNYWKVVDSLLSQIDSWIEGGTNTITLSDVLWKELYKFLAYTFFRSPAWEIFWLTLESCFHQWWIEALNNPSTHFKLGKFHDESSERIYEWLNKVMVSKWYYNRTYLMNKDSILQMEEWLKTMNMTLLYAGNADVKYITNSEVFTLFEYWDTMQQTTFIIPLDPQLCILIGWKIDSSHMKLTINSDEQVKKLNWALLYNQVFKKFHPFIVAKQKKEVERLISEYALKAL